MIRREGRSDARNGRQGGKARPFQFCELGQSRLHERAIDSDKRHDIAHRRQADEIERGAKIGFGLARITSGFPQRTVQGHQEQEHDPAAQTCPRPEVSRAGWD